MSNSLSSVGALMTPTLVSSSIFFISFITISMARSENQTTIAISRIHYEALQNLAHKNETFDQIVGKLLKTANLEPLK